MDFKKFELVYNENRHKFEDKVKVEGKIREIVGDKNVSSKEIDLLAYSKDSTLLTLNWVIEGKIAGLADFITWPETVDHIVQILKFANQEKIPIIPFGEGSGVVGGSIPIYGGIILDMKKFNKVLKINDKDLTITVETGINGMNLERYLNTKGYTCGHIPQSLYTSSVGGWIAHRAAGQFSTKYGKIEDIILGLEIILPQGEIIDFKPIIRAATGPQLDKLFIGNEGTLGIVTKATLKIWPYPEKRKLISYAFPSFESSLETIRLILREHIFPAVIRIYDGDETLRHFSEIEEATNKVMVIFVCEGARRLVDLEETITREICEQNLGVDCGEHPVEHWFESRFKVTETSTIPPYKMVFDTIEVSVSWDNAVKMYHQVIESVKKIRGIVMITAHVSHFYPNGAGFYFSFLGTETGEDTKFKFYRQVWNTTIKAVLDAGGSIAHHHGIGINRSYWMDAEWGKSMKVLRSLKKLLDPNNILNPGKIYESLWNGGEN